MRIEMRLINLLMRWVTPLTIYKLRGIYIISCSPHVVAHLTKKLILDYFFPFIMCMLERWTGSYIDSRYDGAYDHEVFSQVGCVL